MPTLNPGVVTDIDFLSVASDIPLVEPGGRLTLSASNSVSDGSNSTLIYYLPHIHGIMPLFSNSRGRWIYRRIPDSGMSINISTFQPGNYDLYALLSNDESQFSLVTQSWPNDTSRSIQLSLRDGVRCLSFSGTSNNTRIYLGSFRLTGAVNAGRAQDSAAQRFIFNAYNQVIRLFFNTDLTASWSYGSNVWRAMNNSAASRIEVFSGLPGRTLDLSLATRCDSSAGRFGFISMGVNSNSVQGTDLMLVSAGFAGMGTLNAQLTAPLGFSYIQPIENVFGGSVTFYGSGYTSIRGTWWA